MAYRGRSAFIGRLSCFTLKIDEQSSLPAGQTIKTSLCNLNISKHEKAQCNAPMGISFLTHKIPISFQAPGSTFVPLEAHIWIHQLVQLLFITYAYALRLANQKSEFFLKELSQGILSYFGHVQNLTFIWRKPENKRLLR